MTACGFNYFLTSLFYDFVTELYVLQILHVPEVIQFS